MNYLIVVEDNMGSATMNIALKVAKELSQRYKVCGCFCFSENVHDKDAEKYFAGTIMIGNYNDELYRELETYGWRAKSINQKITFLLTHPSVMSRYVSHRIIHGKKLADYSDKVKAYIEDNNIGAIIGFTNPYAIAGFIAGLNTSCKKAVCQMDPFSTYQYLGSRVRENRKIIEKETLAKIDYLFTTKLIIDDLRELGMFEGDSAKPVEIEFPLISVNSPKRPYEGKPILKKEAGKLYFLHAGTLIETIRNPRILVDIFEKLPDNYILVLAGRGADLIRKYDQKIRSRIINLGMVSSHDADRLKSEVDFLISFNNLTYNMVPSKLFECIDSGKPFLNICQLDNCPTISYVKDYENACMIYADKADPESIKTFAEAKKGHIVDHEVIVEKYRACTIGYYAKLIEDNLGSC